MPLDAMEREVIIRRHEEITVAGITRTRTLYAAGYLTQNGSRRLVACIGCNWCRQAAAADIEEKPQSAA